MKTSELTEALRRLGLNRYEALVFLNLARSGAATAGEIARTSGVNRVQTYRALDSLEGRGLVEVDLDRPKRFAARAIKEVVDMVAEEKRLELEGLEAIRKGLLVAWPKAEDRRRESPSVKLQVIKGRRQIYAAMRRLVEGARVEILAFTTAKGLQRSLRSGINDALVAATRRGVKARFLAEITAENAVLMERVVARVPLRHVERQRGRFTIVDRQVMIAFLVLDEGTIRGEGETALWTNSPDFARAHAELFDRVWASAIPAKRRLARLRVR